MGAPFERILCGVEGNPASTEAARQAIVLAGEDGEVHFTAVYTSFELGPDYHRDALEKSLDEAVSMASEAGVTASRSLREAKYATDVLLPESRDHDLLVIGTHGHSRAHGIVFGSTASQAAHNLESPLLVARAAGGGNGFAGRIVFATDGSEGSWAPARAAAGLASRFGSELEVLHVADGKHDDAPPVIEKQVAELAERSGTTPKVTTPEGHATKEIVELAKEDGASLIVAGRRGVKGIKSLGSVSERIVTDAHCSVLLVPANA